MSLSVSVISTVLNEGASIARLLDSLASQSRLPDEVVIADGGSSDDTVSILQRYAARAELEMQVLVRPGTNISQGRNAAIAIARGEIIACVDAGVRLSPNWLEELIRPFEGGTEVHAVAGFFVADPQTPFEVAMGATVLPDLSNIDPARFLPSSRSVAFRKAAWEAVGGYPEWLDYCEDLVFDFGLRDRYGPFVFAPHALVYFRPRSTMAAFTKQYYRYARGDGKADLWRKRHAIRYLTYLVAGPVLVALACWHSPWWLLGLLLGGAIYTAAPYRRLVRRMASLSLGQQLFAILLVPCIRVAGDAAKMAGYPAGWAWRLAHRHEIPQS